MGYPVKFLALMWVNATVMSVINALVLATPLLHIRCMCRAFAPGFRLRFGLAYNAREGLLMQRQADFPLVSGTTHMCITARTITIASDFSLPGTGIHDHGICNHRLPLFPTWGNHGTGTTHTPWQAVHKDDRHIRPGMNHFSDCEASQLFRCYFLWADL